MNYDESLRLKKYSFVPKILFDFARINFVVYKNLGIMATFYETISVMSDILNIAHEMAQDLFRVGAMDAITMRKVDALCLPKMPPLDPEDIRRIRTANHVSQAISWHRQENGATVGTGPEKTKCPAQRLLDLIDRKGLSALG